MHELTVVSRLLRCMVDNRGPNDFCDALANAVFHDLDVLATYIGVLRADGTVDTAGSWGYPPSGTPFFDRPSLWQSMATTDSIRTGRMFLFEDWDAYASSYPHLNGLHSRTFEGSVTVPFSYRGRRAGCVVVAFREPLSALGFSEELWPVLAEAAAVLLATSSVMARAVRGTADLEQLTPEFEAEKVLEMLTGRERRVLQLVAAGLTSRQVARLMHLSESSIKQTRMSLGRKLGVRRRVDLESAARALGLDIPDEGTV